MQALSINFAGVIADRQTFLDGARDFTIEGEDQPSTGWRLNLGFRWPVESERVEEGDVTLFVPDGGEIYGTFRDGRASDITDEAGNVNAGQLDLTFDVTGGEGAYASAEGTIRVDGTLAGEGPGTGGSYEGEGLILTVNLSLEGGGDLSRYRPTENIPTGTPQRYREPRGQ